MVRSFLDEGHATWAMPGREKGFYAAWKFLAQREWSPCGIKTIGRNWPDCRPSRKTPLLESLTVLGIHRRCMAGLSSLHLAALPGWAGFIKWRADQSEYEWQTVYPVDLVQYLAVRLWYERELVAKACRKRSASTAIVHALERNTKPPKSARHPSPTATDQARRRSSDAWRLAATGASAGFGTDPAAQTQAIETCGCCSNGSTDFPRVRAWSDMAQSF